MNARTKTMRAYWTRSLDRNRARYLSETVPVNGVPTMRGLALLLRHAQARGWNGRLNSSDRRKGVAERYGHESQAALYKSWRAGLPGFNPANPPGRSSHELRSDGNRVFGKPAGARLPWWQMGLDVSDDAHLLAVLRTLNVDIRHPYNTVSEAHHLNVIDDPTHVLVHLGDV